MPAKRSHTGIRARHSRTCSAHEDHEARCSCRPYYEAAVYLKREKKKVRKSFPTLAAAKAWRADALSAMNRGKLRAPTTTTLKQAADEWLEGAKAGTVANRKGRRYKPSALRGYERALQNRVLPELGHMKLSEVRRSDVQAFVDRLGTEGLGASTIANTIDPLRAIYRRALRREEVAVNPTSDLEVPRSHGKRERIAGPDEADRLLAALPDAERPLWATAMYAGLRRGELLALRWKDINLGAREITVSRTWDDVAGEMDGGKSDAARRSVPIIGALKPLLAQHKLRTGRGEEDLVFGFTAAEPFVTSTVRARARAAWKADKLDPITMHECRHTFASTSIAAGVDARTLMEVMGHASITMTFNRYGHLMPGGLARAAQLIDAFKARESSG